MPIITLTSDYGPERYYAGILRGALLAAVPDAQVVDLSHDVRKFSETMQHSFPFMCTAFS